MPELEANQLPEKELYQADNQNKAWKWIKMYYIKANVDSKYLAKYVVSNDPPGINPDLLKGGLGWWLETYDQPDSGPLEARFWEASFVPEGGVVMVRVLLILLNSKGDPWEGRGMPQDLNYVPEIPGFDDFFVRPVKGESHLAFGMKYLGELMSPPGPPTAVSDPSNPV